MNFFKAYSSMVFLIQNIINKNLLNENDDQVGNILINNDFIIFWVNLSQENNTAYSELTPLFENLRKITNLSSKLDIIFVFLQELATKKKILSKEIYKYFADRLFPQWFSKSGSQ